MKGLNEMQLEALKQEPVTKQALKETGLAFDEMMAVKLTVPDEDVFTRAGWCIGWTGRLDPNHIDALQKFAILRWYYSDDASKPGNEQRRQAAGIFVHTATLGTYANDGSAFQQGRKTGAEETNKIKKRKAAENVKQAAKIWRELEQAGRPERERVAVIAQRMPGAKPDTIRGWIRKAGLR